MRFKTLCDDAVLNSNIVNISIDGESLIATPRYRKVVEDHILTLCNACCILTRVTSLAHATIHRQSKVSRSLNIIQKTYILMYRTIASFALENDHPFP